MPSTKALFESTLLYNDRFSLSFGIHSSLAAGIPSYRIVHFNSEVATTGESRTDQTSVGYAATPGASAQVCGVTIDGSTPLTGSEYLPSFNRDRNVTVTLLGSMLVEVAPGAIIAAGSVVNENAVGQAAATGTATPFVAMTASTGVGTATNPEYILVLVR